MSNVQILSLMPKKIEFLFRKKIKHASRAKNSIKKLTKAKTLSNKLGINNINRRVK